MIQSATMKKLILPLGVVSLLAIGCPPQEAKVDDSKAVASPVFPATTHGTAGTTTMTTTTSASIDAHPDVKAQKVKVGVKFEPAIIPAKKGQPLALEITRTTEKTCATEVIFDGGPLAGKKIDLPLNQAVRVSFTPEADGDIVFGCAMGRMISGKIRVAS